MIQAYVFSGAAGSGRREVMADLIASGILEPGQSCGVTVLLAAGEPASAEDSVFDGKATVLRWNGFAEGAQVPELPADTQVVLFLLDGRADPVDQFENLSKWFNANQDVTLARIITVLNCRLLSDKPELNLWFDACINFSDVVLLNNRTGVPNKWFSDLQTHYKKGCFPCLFELVKDGRVRNPAEVLFPEPRRISLAFDIFNDEALDGAAGKESLEYEIVDETGDDEEVIEEDADDDEKPEPERFFERDVSGRRRVRLPNIASSL